MPVLTLRPNTGSGGLAQHTPVGSTPNWTCCDESSSDGDSTYCSNAGDTAQVDRYGHQDSGGQAGVINSVKLFILARCATIGSTQTVATNLRTNSTNFTGSANDLTSVLTYTLFSTTYSVNPQTGVAWTWAQVNAILAGFTTTTGGGSEVRVTQVYVEVDYNSVFQMAAPAIVVVSIPTPTFEHHNRLEMAAPAIVVVTVPTPAFSHPGLAEKGQIDRLILSDGITDRLRIGSLDRLVLSDGSVDRLTLGIIDRLNLSDGQEEVL